MNNRPQRFDLIVFDWDGTLFDSTRLITRCIQAACADVGAPVPSDRDAAYVIGMGLAEALAHAAPGLPPQHYPELRERYRHHYFAQQHEVVLFEGALEMLQALKSRHHWLGVATGKSRRGLDEELEPMDEQPLVAAEVHRRPPGLPTAPVHLEAQEAHDDGRAGGGGHGSIVIVYDSVG